MNQNQKDKKNNIEKGERKKKSTFWGICPLIKATFFEKKSIKYSAFFIKTIVTPCLITGSNEIFIKKGKKSIFVFVPYKGRGGHA